MTPDPSSSFRDLTAYCIRPWCFVDHETCATYSENRVYRSSYFPFDSGVDLFYSYSVCNSTADDWLSAETTVLGGEGGRRNVLGGVNIRAAVPVYMIPCECVLVSFSFRASAITCCVI